VEKRGGDLKKNLVDFGQES